MGCGASGRSVASSSAQRYQVKPAESSTSKPSKYHWTFHAPFPSAQKELTYMSLEWPASFEIHFKVLNLRKGRRFAGLFSCNIGSNMGDHCRLYTNGGWDSAPPEYGTLTFIACGKKFGVGRPYKGGKAVISNGETVHVVCTLNRSGEGHVWVNGEDLTFIFPEEWGSLVNGPFCPLQNVPVCVGADEGLAEFYKFHIHEGVALQASEVKQLYLNTTPPSTHHWTFNAPFPAAPRQLTQMTLEWPASFEINFRVLNLHRGQHCAGLFACDKEGAKKSEGCCLYTNGGADAEDPEYGTLTFVACGKQFGVGDPSRRGKPVISDGETVHVICTFDRSGDGHVWLNGEEKAFELPVKGRTGVKGPFGPLQDAWVSVGSDGGFAEIYQFRIHRGVALKENDIKQLHLAVAPPAAIEVGGASLQRVSDRKLLAGLQSCLETNPDWLGRGRDVAGAAPSEMSNNNRASNSNSNSNHTAGAYGWLELVRAWSVDHHFRESRYDIAKQELRHHSEQLEGGLTPCDLQSDGWSTFLGIRLSKALNESLALHGTKPDVLMAILSSGLNERYSSGHFGDGTYLAEDAGKADQYCSVDEERRDCDLHEALYPEGVGHPGDVCYMLLCQILLGEPAITWDGSKNIRGGELYANPDTKRELAEVPNSSPPFAHHSLLVETGAAVQRYREIVSFHSERILVKYLIAYRRRR